MELAQGRHFDSYGASMDAALNSKIKDIQPWLVCGTIVDRGCGTGSLMKLLASRNRKIVGIDSSDALTTKLHGVINANLTDPVFADGFVDNIILSSVMHEVYSYNGYSHFPVFQCLSNCARELREGGRIIIRDIWSPEDNKETCELTFDKVTKEKFLSYIKGAPRVPQFSGHIPSIGTGRFRIEMRDVVEFLSKKDYVRHWDIELKEVYTSIPLSIYKSIARILNLKIAYSEVSANPWIIKNRWSRGVKFVSNRPQYTNQLIVLEK